MTRNGHLACGWLAAIVATLWGTTLGAGYVLVGIAMLVGCALLTRG